MPRITLSLCCALVLGIALYAAGGTASPANAPVEVPVAAIDESGFIEALATDGMHFESSESAVGVGRGACDALARDVGPSHIADLLAESLSITITEAQLFVLSAVDSFCPGMAGGQP